jgi:hypothetical protein
MGRSRVDKLPKYGVASQNSAVPKGAMGQPKTKAEAMAKLDKLGKGVVARGKASVRASNKAAGRPSNSGISPSAVAAGSTSKLVRLAKQQNA